MDEAFSEQTLCKRTVHARSGKRTLSIEVSIGSPVLDPNQKNWWCSIQLAGIEKLLDPPRQVWRVAGYDGFQALNLALEHIGRLLDQTGLKWTAFPERDFGVKFSSEPDDGFWRPMTSSVPAEFRQKKERLVKEEIEKAYENGEIQDIYRRMKSG